MNDLGGALRELAREAAAPPATDPHALWAKGRSRVRRRRLLAVGAIAALAVVVGVGTLAVAPTTTVVVPAAAPHAYAVPKNVWHAKDWFAGTADTGPPGIVAVLGGVGRDGGNGAFVVSARTGTYRLLDLPGQADPGGTSDVATALSPDGRHIAYWLTGRPGGIPFPDEHGGDLPIGVGVYDTVDGSVERFLPPTEHGIKAAGLAWLDAETLMVTFGERTGGSSANRIKSYSWTLGDVDRPVVRDDASLMLWETIPNRGGGLLQPLHGNRYGVLQPDGSVSDESSVTLPAARAASYQEVARSSTYAVARVHQDEGNEETWVGRIGTHGVVDRMAPVTGLGTSRVMGWLAEDRVLVVGDASSGDEYASLYALDLRTLKPTRLGTAEGGWWAPGLSFASDLLDAPMVHGQRPPQVNPRWLDAAGAAGAVLLVAFAIRFVRRRRRG